MKRNDPLQLFKFRFLKLSCICNFFPSLVIILQLYLQYEY